MRSQKMKDKTATKTDSTKRKHIEKEGYTEHVGQKPKRIKETNTKENKDREKIIEKETNKPNKLKHTEKDEIEVENAKLRNIIFKQKDNILDLWNLLKGMANNTGRIHSMLPDADKNNDYQQQIHSIEVFIQKANTNNTKNLLFESLVNKINKTVNDFTPTVLVHKVKYRGPNNEQEYNVSEGISEVFTKVPVKTLLDADEQDLVDKIYCNPEANAD